jgi:two-component system, OmpR family, response regulator
MSTTEKETSRVLVVDDNRDAAASLALLLGAAGFKVETAFCGEAALEKAETFKPDACVLDINMPGMNGYELAQHLKAQTPEHQPVLATMTGYDDHDHLERAASAGFDLHFRKGSDPREVIEQLVDECAEH